MLPKKQRHRGAKNENEIQMRYGAVTAFRRRTSGTQVDEKQTRSERKISTTGETEVGLYSSNHLHSKMCLSKNNNKTTTQTSSQELATSYAKSMHPFTPELLQVQHVDTLFGFFTSIEAAP